MSLQGREVYDFGPFTVEPKERTLLRDGQAVPLPPKAFDLLVVLDQVDSPWEELRRMDDVLWSYTERSGVTVSAWPVSVAEFEHPTTPVLIRASAEAVPVG